MSGAPRPHVVVLSTADFHSAVWTNKQHLSVRLAASCDVLYVESLGLRRPALRPADVRRMLARVARRRPRGDARPDPGEPRGVTVVGPLVLPWHDSRLCRVINHVLLRVQVGRKVRRDSILWTFSPVTYGLERRAAATVYHSVDLLHEQPKIAREHVVRSEAYLLGVADVVLASSVGVRDHLERLGRQDVQLWENVADVELFRSSRPPRARRAIFAGNLTPEKVDFELLAALARAGIDVALAGPRGIDGVLAGSALDDLLSLPRVEYLGNLGRGDLADAVAASMVGVIPYRDNPYTAGVFPMKVYEYLAAGLAVVSTPLPSLREPIVGLCLAAPEDFVATVEKELAAFGDEGVEARRAAAEGRSWTERARQATALVARLQAAGART